MVNKSFLISFDYRLDRGKIIVSLRADVEVNRDPPCYIVRNIRSRRDGSTPAIPEVRLTKTDSVWVHYDSQKPTDLTLCIGAAIEAHERR